MDHEVLTHEKVRFRREDIALLETMPSACTQDRRIARRSYTADAGRVIGLVAAALAVLLVVFSGLIYVAGTWGVGSERLRVEAEGAIRAFAGADVDVESGPARISLDGSRFIGLEVPDMRLSVSATGANFIEAGSLRFGLHLWPLLGGDVQLRSLRLADARISTAASPATGSGDWGSGLKNADSLVDPDLAIEAVFSLVHRLFDAAETRSTRRIELENVEIVFGKGDVPHILRIADAELSRSFGGALRFSAEMDFGGRRIAVEGEATRDADRRLVDSLQVKVSSDDPARDAAPALPRPGELPTLQGAFELVLSGKEALPGDAARIDARLSTRSAALHSPKGDSLSGDVDLSASLVSGTGKIEIDRLLMTAGRSRLTFHGAVGPAPKTGLPGERPAYRYELVSDGSTIAAADVPEPALNFVARLSGLYLPEESRLDAREIGVRTSQGELIGTASVDFAQGRAPSVILALDMPSMPVAHVKQLWPWLSAPGVRNWTLQNVYGGTVKDSWLRLSVESGRLGNGIPLSADEVSGHFRVEDARFDVTGEIPPVRDAHGIVDFRGTDVDISLSSGTVFMPSGRTVAASAGTFAIREAHRKPVIGKLDIDVAGEAPAVVELASYPPINAMKRLALVPEDFTGEVSGNVKSDIPLSRNVPVGYLGWQVALDYTGLSLAKPFDGQTVTDAAGTIAIDPAKAVIEAKARLNGLPARLALVEPLEGEGAERKRDIEIELDDRAREALAPGLNTILSGPVLVDFESGGSGTQHVTADLTKATLQLPWMGWTKGAGVPAAATFTLTVDGETAELADFRLDGNTFGASGRIVLTGGALSSARFDRARLNRDDSVSVDLKRSGKGYAVAVRGEAIDARALINQLRADKGGGRGGGTAVPVSIEADVKRVAGFGGETLSNVKLAYSGAGSRVDSLSFSAVSRGGAVSASDSQSGSVRSVQMESSDAGALLRFLNVYDHMEGGAMRLALKGEGRGPLRGQIDTRNFWLVNEPRLRSIVATAPAGDGRSLNEAVRRDIDTSKVHFERGFSLVEKGDGYLTIANGVLRGPLIGTTFQGTLFDKQGNMSITGTFMPAYGLNRLFAEIPLIGQILGNGRDRGLIGITYKLAGDAKSPKLQINPISAIAPGIFRSIFEFN